MSSYFDRLKCLLQITTLTSLAALQKKNVFSSTQRANGVDGTCIILTPGNIPTTDYYFSGGLLQNFSSIQRINVLDESPRNLRPTSDSLVIIVRYLPMRWLFWLMRYRGPVGGFAFFMGCCA